MQIAMTATEAHRTAGDDRRASEADGDADDRARTVGPRIRMRMSTLTPREAGVVQLMLHGQRLTERTGIKDIAGAAGVSDAMIVKIAKKLGYSGFKDLRRALGAYNRLPIAAMHQELSVGDGPETIIQKVFDTALQAVAETRSILKVADLQAAAESLFRARQRDFYGVGGSAAIARDAAHKFLRIGLRTTMLDDAHLMMMSAALMSRGDAVLAVSHSGRTLAVIEPARLAKSNGATLIAVSNDPASPLARDADIVLCSTAQGSPLMGENAASRVAQLCILDALFVAVAQLDYSAAERSLGKTAAAVRGKRDVASP
jgi:RpiR family transcriptional regulator, repressor of rpiB and als operon